MAAKLYPNYHRESALLALTMSVDDFTSTGLLLDLEIASLCYALVTDDHTLAVVALPADHPTDPYGRYTVYGYPTELGVSYTITGTHGFVAYLDSGAQLEPHKVALLELLLTQGCWLGTPAGAQYSFFGA